MPDPAAAVRIRRLPLLLWLFVGLVAIVVAGLPISMAGAGGAGTADDAAVQRLAGESRFETAGLIATERFGTSGRVVVARGGDWPDALAGNFLAGIFGSPVLLISQASVPQAALDTFTDLGVTDITLLGGPVAISPEAEQELVDAGYAVERILGPSRYETAVAVAEQATSVQRGTTAVVATGENFADALVIGPVAYSEGFPLLLTPRDALHPATAEYLSDPTIAEVIIPGGPAAVSLEVEQELVDLGKTVRRLAGPGRVETAVTIASYAVDVLGYDLDRVFVATANPFADALSLAAAAGAARGPLLIADGQADELNANLDAFLRANACDITAVTIAGGTGAFGAAAEADVLAAVNDCTSTPEPTETPTEEPVEITAPLLTAVTLVETTAQGSTYRYTFDRDVAVGGQPGRFRLAAPYTSLIIEPMVQPFDAEHVPFINHAETAVADPADAASVLATFEGDFFDGVGDVLGPEIVTNGYVAAGAVTTEAGGSSPEGAAGIQGFEAAAGESFGPNLVSVTAIDAGANTATFNFDKDVDVLFDDEFHLVVQAPNGFQPFDLQSTAAVEGADGRSVVATFPDFAGDADIRRGWVNDGAVEGLQIFGPFLGTPLSTTQSVVIAGVGETTAPDLMTIIEDQQAGTIDFTFDNRIDPSVPLDPSLFHMYFIDGSLQIASAVQLLAEQQTVRATFAPPGGQPSILVSDGILGAGVDEGAVTGDNGFVGMHDELGFARSFGVGGTAAGSWTAATLQDDVLSLTFDRRIPDVNGDELITLYDATGAPLTDAVSGCAITPGDELTVVTCDVTAAAQESAVIVGIAQHAVSGDVIRDFFNTRIGNIDQNRLLPSS